MWEESRRGQRHRAYGKTSTDLGEDTRSALLLQLLGPWAARDPRNSSIYRCVKRLAYKEKYNVVNYREDYIQSESLPMNLPSLLQV